MWPSAASSSPLLLSSCSCSWVATGRETLPTAAMLRRRVSRSARCLCTSVSCCWCRLISSPVGERVVRQRRASTTAANTKSESALRSPVCACQPSEAAATQPQGLFRYLWGCSSTRQPPDSPQKHAWELHNASSAAAVAAETAPQLQQTGCC